MRGSILRLSCGVLVLRLSRGVVLRVVIILLDRGRVVWIVMRVGDRLRLRSAPSKQAASS